MYKAITTMWPVQKKKKKTRPALGPIAIKLMSLIKHVKAVISMKVFFYQIYVRKKWHTKNENGLSLQTTVVSQNMLHFTDYI